ncbi:MAG: response regulator [Planctomycetota bacterium]
MTTSKKPNACRPNSIGISGSALDRLLDQFDGSGENISPRREFVRRAYRKHGIMIRVAQLSGLDVTLRVACRNLSRGGMSVLHNAYLHPGSRIAAALPHPIERFIKVTGTVVRSTHRTGTVHEIGIKFDEPIDPGEFIRTDDPGDGFALEHVDTELLVGSLLHLDDSELDRRIVQHYLRDTQLRIRAAATVDEGLEIAAEGVDLILSDYYLEEETSERLISDLRTSGNQTPIIVVSGDNSVETQDKLAALDVSGYLTKPFPQELLLRAVGEFLLVRTADSNMRSTLDSTDPNFKLVDAFVGDLKNFAERLDDTLSKGNSEACRSVCLQIRSAAPLMGFAMLGQMADKAARAIALSSEIDEASAEIRALRAACLRAKK